MSQNFRPRQHSDDHDYSQIFSKENSLYKRKRRSTDPSAPVQHITINKIQNNQFINMDEIPGFAKAVIVFNMVIWCCILTVSFSTVFGWWLTPVFLILWTLFFLIVFILQIIYYKIFWYIVALQWTISSLALLIALSSGIQLANFLIRFSP